MMSQPMNIDAGDAAFQAEVTAVKGWWSSSRWRHMKKLFTAEQIEIVEKRFEGKITSYTYRMFTSVSGTLDTVYLTRWQCLSTASSDCYMTRWRLFMAELFHDCKQRKNRFSKPKSQWPAIQIDYLRPIIADADTGHGGLIVIMKVTKFFVEALNY
ncbi:ICL-domain-containing protein [Terfezia boudieri ATCC MYA-4762]|uniref:methylisocitrate lyase n=1 Tax=Terfezia boudieri ATCC MYA-4762 TaxID=1051890 RepID=A0A3N4LNQ3_9PEZI|nr:ICL-domain-containing protein [Terfezia boudieri ATCC MYA-4762]